MTINQDVKTGRIRLVSQITLSQDVKLDKILYWRKSLQKSKVRQAGHELL